MNKQWLAGFFLLLPGFALAEELCEDAEDTAALNKCIHAEVEKAEGELNRYLEASRTLHAKRADAVVTMEAAQGAWVRYRDSHCLAVYDLWHEGTVRGAMLGTCLLDHTRRRTHDIWEVYLASSDDEPVLPEPSLDM
ncbi:MULTISPECIES: lysozyme inhibitor LprI family protein [Pseudomonas]|uniref:lysozyme inhibitor LprI family protein n=1 Tax=Pseudomonas TaxID=286 RepID=UPI00123A3C0A|nr:MULTISPECIES: lysozyme inhibitor LprI family protein [Pseudomonas]QIB50846.1 DUF1311 domain-containing protein [Pseudomonas sp. OIL-1]